jgi:hypothetical protein
MMTENDVLRLFLARRENYGVVACSHQKGRVYEVVMNDESYHAVVLISSFAYYELRYHIATHQPTLVICYEHTSVLPIPVLSLRAGNLAKAYELPETIIDVAAQRFTRVGSQVLLGQYICGVKAAQTLIEKEVPCQSEAVGEAKKRKAGRIAPRCSDAGSPRKEQNTMIIWSDDCGDCLCNLPHSMEKHMQQVERASAELQHELAELRAWNRDGEEWTDGDEDSMEEEESQEDELTPDELANVAAYFHSCREELERTRPDPGVPILDYYCWDNEHQGGWSCRECYAQQQKGDMV